MILSDTQELLSLHEMQASMMNFVKSAFEDADILIYMVEIGTRFERQAFFNKIIHIQNTCFLIVE
jgi:GTP-binding protein Era